MAGASTGGPALETPPWTGAHREGALRRRRGTIGQAGVVAAAYHDRDMPGPRGQSLAGVMQSRMVRSIGISVEDYAVSGKFTGKTAPLILYQSDRAFRTAVR